MKNAIQPFFVIFRNFLNFYRILLLKKMRLLVGILNHCVLGLRGQNSLDHHYVKHPVFYCITAICPPTPTTIVVLQPKPLAQSRLAFRRLLVQQHEFKLRLLEMSNVINETEALLQELLPTANCMKERSSHSKTSAIRSPLKSKNHATSLHHTQKRLE